MNLRKLSKKTFWDEYWNQLPIRKQHSHLFEDMFTKFLPKNLSFFEVGCAPGIIMEYFSRRFGYTVSGIDYSSIETVRHYLTTHDAHFQDLYSNDFLEFSISNVYDVVASFGFVEHFENPENIIKRHMALVAPEGYLVIEVPNLRYANRLIYRMFNRELLDIHNTHIMDPNIISQSILTSSEFDILFSGYYKSCFLYFNPDNPELNKHPFLRKVFAFLRDLFTFLKLENLTSRYFSPYIFVIAQRSKPQQTI